MPKLCCHYTTDSIATCLPRGTKYEPSYQPLITLGRWPKKCEIIIWHFALYVNITPCMITHGHDNNVFLVACMLNFGTRTMYLRELQIPVPDFRRRSWHRRSGTRVPGANTVISSNPCCKHGDSLCTGIICRITVAIFKGGITMFISPTEKFNIGYFSTS